MVSKFWSGVPHHLGNLIQSDCGVATIVHQVYLRIVLCKLVAHEINIHCNNANFYTWLLQQIVVTLQIDWKVVKCMIVYTGTIAKAAICGREQ
jgi:hypothetical protein